MDVSDIFNFFLLGEGEGGVRGAGEGGGDRNFIQNPTTGGGGGSRTGGAEGPGGCLRRIGDFFLGGGGAGAKHFFFRGRNVHRGKSLPIAEFIRSLPKNFANKLGLSVTKSRVLVRSHTKKFTQSSPKAWEDKFLGILCLAPICWHAIRISWITHPHFIFHRKGRTWAIAVRRGSRESLFLLNSGRFSLEK